MKILIVSSYLPYPLHSGGHIRLYNILKRLNNKHQISLVCEKRPYQTKKDVKEIEKICQNVITVPRKKQWSFFNMVRTGLSNKPFLLMGHNLPKMREEIEEILEKGEFDLIHVETFYVAQNLPKTKLPVVVVEHNIEYLVYKRYAQETNLLLKPLVKTDVLKLKVQEEKIWEKADAVVAVSKQDKEIIEQFNKNVFVVPNGVDLDKFKFRNEKRITNHEKTILYIGDFKWVQNRDAVDLILKKIWPVLNLKFIRSNIKLKLWIVGKNIPKHLKDIGGENVLFDENATDDTSEIFKKSDILLAPIRVGGGTSYKILEAMASGVPVVTTMLGAIGLSARDKEEVIIADTEEKMVESITNLLKNRTLADNLVKNARVLVEENYSWDIITSQLDKVYQELITNN